MTNKLQLFFLILTGLFFSQSILAQTKDDNELEKIIRYDNAISDSIEVGVFYEHILDFNAKQKNWLGTEGYRETINCYFRINENTSEVELVKITVVLQQEEEQAFKSYLYNDSQRPMMCYNSYIKNGKTVGNQGAYFGKGSIVALSANDTIIVGDDLTDEMVNAARDMYLNGERYRQLFETVVSIQSR